MLGKVQARSKRGAREALKDAVCALSQLVHALPALPKPMRLC